LSKGVKMEIQVMNNLGLQGKKYDNSLVLRLQHPYDFYELQHYGVRKYTERLHDPKQELRYFLKELRRVKPQFIQINK